MIKIKVDLKQLERALKQEIRDKASSIVKNDIKGNPNVTIYCNQCGASIKRTNINIGRLKANCQNCQAVMTIMPKLV